MSASEQQRLVRLFKQLPPDQQQTLLTFAEFLHTRLPPPKSLPVQPKWLPRPPNESVVAAIKRLAQSYPMLDKAKILDEASALMTEHILQGRDKTAVINDLEAMFLRHYEEFIREDET